MIKILNVKSLYSALYETVDFCKNKESERIRLVGEKKRFSFKNLFGKNK